MGPLFDAFGIDWRMIIAQIINFGLLLVLLSWLLYRPILRTIDTRREKIAQGLADAAAAETAAAQAAALSKTTITAAESEAAALLSRAKANTAAVCEQLDAEARARAEGIIRDGEARADEARAKAIRESQQEIARLAILAAEGALRTAK